MTKYESKDSEAPRVLKVQELGDVERVVFKSGQSTEFDGEAREELVVVPEKPSTSADGKISKQAYVPPTSLADYGVNFKENDNTVSIERTLTDESPSSSEKKKREKENTSKENPKSNTTGVASSNVNNVTGSGAPHKTQTVFIHKLYDMLEDRSISHLIWWLSNNESFCLSTGEEFSKALSQYFKHTNLASFIRQLNMYGFHKVNDSAQSEGDSGIWEFRHSANQFHKGDYESLKLIKRRSSKNFKAQKTQQINTHPQNIEEQTVLRFGTSTPPTGGSQQNYHKVLHQHQQQQVMYQNVSTGMERAISPSQSLPFPKQVPHPYGYQIGVASSHEKDMELQQMKNTVQSMQHNLEVLLAENIAENVEKVSLLDLISTLSEKVCDDVTYSKLNGQVNQLKTGAIQRINNIRLIQQQHVFSNYSFQVPAAQIQPNLQVGLAGTVPVPNSASSMTPNLNPPSHSPPFLENFKYLSNPDVIKTQKENLERVHDPLFRHYSVPLNDKFVLNPNAQEQMQRDRDLNMRNLAQYPFPPMQHNSQTEPGKTYSGLILNPQPESSSHSITRSYSSSQVTSNSNNNNNNINNSNNVTESNIKTPLPSVHELHKVIEKLGPSKSSERLPSMTKKRRLSEEPSPTVKKAIINE